MKKIALLVIVVSTLGIIGINTCYAENKLSNYTNNNQDYLILGKITYKKTDEKCTIEVSEIIESSSRRTDIPKEIRLYSKLEKFKKGDCIAISIDENQGKYIVKNGAYKITTDDSDTLEVIPRSPEEDLAELAVAELFLRSRGKIKEIYLEEGNAYFKKVKEAEVIQIFDKSTGNKNIPIEMEKGEKHIVISTQNTVVFYTFIVIAMILCVCYIVKNIRNT